MSTEHKRNHSILTDDWPHWSIGEKMQCTIIATTAAAAVVLTAFGFLTSIFMLPNPHFHSCFVCVSAAVQNNPSYFTIRSIDRSYNDLQIVVCCLHWNTYILLVSSTYTHNTHRHICENYKIKKLHHLSFCPGRQSILLTYADRALLRLTGQPFSNRIIMHRTVDQFDLHLLTI